MELELSSMEFELWFTENGVSSMGTESTFSSFERFITGSDFFNLLNLLTNF